MAFEERINEFFHGKQFMFAAWAAMAVSAFVAASSGRIEYVDCGHGIFFDVADILVGRPMLSVFLNVAVVTVIGLLMQLLNKVYGFVRSNTSMLASAFYLLTMSNPFTSYSLYTGTALALILVLGAFYLYVSYLNPRASHSVFLTFTVITFCTMFHWAFVLLLIAFVFGFIEMRAMQWRGIVAMLLGIITPFWILMGLGVVAPSQFMPMEFSSAMASADLSTISLFVVSVVVTAVAAIVLTCVNLYTIIGYRHQWRIYNAFIMLTGIITIVAMCVDYHDMHVFLPLLNECLAVEFAHAFSINKSQYRYAFAVVLAAWSLLSFAAILYV